MLNGRNPRHAPPSAATSTEISVACGRKSETASIEAHPMPHTPAASPSSPSMRFKAFVMPTIQRSVTGTLSAPSAIASAEASPGFVRIRITTPCRMATTAAAICKTSLTQGRSETRSSTAPVTTMMTLPSNIPCTGSSMPVNGSTPARKPANSASPPSRGIGWSWMRRDSPGMSIAPILQANFRTAGVASRHTAAAASSASSTRTRSRRARAGSIPFRLSFFQTPPRCAAVPEIY